MTTTIEAPAYKVECKPELLAHTEHLPETVECARCGYVRPATLAE